MDRSVKIFLWLVFTVVFGMSPLIVRYAISRTEQNPISIADTMKTGDLLIVGAVIAADAIGKIFGSKNKHSAVANGVGDHVRRGVKILCGCVCMVLLLAACAEYAQVSSKIDAK